MGAGRIASAAFAAGHAVRGCAGVLPVFTTAVPASHRHTRPDGLVRPTRRHSATAHHGAENPGQKGTGADPARQPVCGHGSGSSDCRRDGAGAAMTVPVGYIWGTRKASTVETLRILTITSHPRWDVAGISSPQRLAFFLSPSISLTNSDRWRMADTYRFVRRGTYGVHQTTSVVDQPTKGSVLHAVCLCAVSDAVRCHRHPDA